MTSVPKVCQYKYLTFIDLDIYKMFSLHASSIELKDPTPTIEVENITSQISERHEIWKIYT